MADPGVEVVFLFTQDMGDIVYFIVAAGDLVHYRNIVLAVRGIKEFFQVICKTFVRKHFAVFAYYQTTTKEFALKAAEKWLEGAK